MRFSTSFVCSVGLAIFLTACGAPNRLISGLTTPAAEGLVTDSKGDNGNTKLTIEVKHLAPPGRVNPNGVVYVVWIVPADGVAQNVGALKVDADLTGTLETLTTQTQFDLWITAEPEATATQPSGPKALTGSVGK